MSWFSVKITQADKLYSQIVRQGKDRCQKCDKVRALQCCHIITRGRQATRYMFNPVQNAVALCADCHKWFDRTTAKDILFNEELQKIKQPDNRWWWLVNSAGYTWQQLLKLHWISEQPMKTTKTLHYQASLAELKKMSAHGM